LPISIHRDQLRNLVESGAQLVEVLPAAEYEEEHLPGAMNIPLKSLNGSAVSALNHGAPVIVYCWNFL
jgi:rhodanese-related sulfurtransferase